jgi:hypothetical protein
VAPRQQVGESGHDAQRLAEVVRCDRRETLKLLV